MRQADKDKAGRSPMQRRSRRAGVLLSGGIDSMACVQFYLEQGFQVRGLFVDYGQLAGTQEEEAATKIAAHYGIELEIARISLPCQFGTGEVVGRNALLVLAALASKLCMAGLIALGIHAGSSYYDCTEPFLMDMRRILDHSSNGAVRLDAPFLTWNKAAIYAYCREKNLPIALTYICESGTTPPRGRCALVWTGRP